jgi:hypothetical protein
MRWDIGHGVMGYTPHLVPRLVHLVEDFALVFLGDVVADGCLEHLLLLHLVYLPIQQPYVSELREVFGAACACACPPCLGRCLLFRS